MGSGQTISDADAWLRNRQHEQLRAYDQAVGAMKALPSSRFTVAEIEFLLSPAETGYVIGRQYTDERRERIRLMLTALGMNEIIALLEVADKEVADAYEIAKRAR